MAPYAIKRRKLKHSSSSASSGSGSAGSTIDDIVPEDNKSPVMRRIASGGLNVRQAEAAQYASGSYNSTMFKLQMDELLVKVRPKYENRMSKAEDALRKIKGIIENIPNCEALSIPDAERKLKSNQIRIPFPEPQPGSGAKYTLAYAKPININVFGSYARKTAMLVEEKLGIDLTVTMPSHIFQEKDFLDFRYFHKKAYYLACIAASLQEANLSVPRKRHTTSSTTPASSEDCNFIVSFAYQNDNPLQPIITINPGAGGESDFTESKCQIIIILAAKEDLFPISKTLPDKSCIRATGENASFQRTSNLPTPLYNGTLRSECSSLPYLKLLHAASLRAEAFGDACLLGSIWLGQRGYSAAITDGGFGQFEWACITALLMHGGGANGRPVLSSGYSSYQLFKAVLQFLSTRDLALKPVLLQSNNFALENSTTPVLFDGARGQNILFKMTTWSYRMLRHEASITLKALGQTISDGFLSSFIAKIDNPLHRFDSVFNLSISPGWTPKSKVLDCMDRHQQFCQEVYDSLVTGLGDRVNLVYPIRTRIPAWPTALAGEPTTANRLDIVVGLLINPEQISRTVDRGPSAEDKQAATAFRKFWGEKSEMRRFKDGSILESLIWNNSGAESGVLQQAVQYIIRRHLGSDIAEGIKFFGNSFNQLLPGPFSGDYNATLRYQPLLSAFETLERDLRSMEGLPLQIRQISAASPALRYASLNIPILPSKGSKMKPADVYVQFEGSARWPDDISAAQRTKIAFLLKIGELMEELLTGLKSRLGLENEKHKFLNIAFLDIIYPAGTVFRLRIHHERELSLLDRLLKEKSYDQGRREEIAHAVSTYKRNFVQEALHTQAVRTLSTRFPLLSPSMRLMKQWRDSHLLTPHISDELIELLTILSFVHPYPWQTPGSVRAAFLRTLMYISKWDWRSEPLIVDFNGELSSKDVDAINLRFEAWRKIDPASNRIVVFTASNLDPDGVTWTEQGPSKVVAARFSSLAKAACEVVGNQGLDVDARTLFASSYADYDFLVHLSPRLVAKARGQGKQLSLFKNLELQAVDDDALVDFDPVGLFLDELCDIYGSNVVFFHGAHQGSVIAGLWNPQTGPRPWKINVPYATMPVPQAGKAEPMISINKAAILNDIARLGGDLVSMVESMR